MRLNGWIAVRVERGFPVEAKFYETEDSALVKEAQWRSVMNPDYDETGVLELALDTNAP